MDPFAIFGIAPTFDLPLASLTQRYRELSRAVHPDKFASAGAGEKRRALAKAVDVNEAWRVLRDPLRRAEALLASLGVPTGDASKAKASPALLMEMMDVRERLSAAKQQRDAEALRGCVAWGEERETRVMIALTAWFARALAPSTSAISPGEAATATALLGELRYLRRLLDETQAVEEELQSATMQ